MPATDPVPINPAVLGWAMEEASVGTGDLAKHLKVEPAEVESWLSGAQLPSTTLVRRMASYLRRSTATLLLPEPPPPSVPPSFRHPPGAVAGREITRRETQGVRTARRLQSLARWLHERMPGVQAPSSVPVVAAKPPSHEAADLLREWLGWSIDLQTEARDPYAVQNEMRGRLEQRGLLVLHLRLGAQGCRGFSLTDDLRPVVAVNRRYIPAARLFTYGHELAHLLIGAGSICLTSFQANATERWCERVAGELLLPEPDLASYVSRVMRVRQVRTVPQVQQVARRFKVSLRATAYRLQATELGVPDLYGHVHTSTDLPGRPADDDGPRERSSRARFVEFGPGFSHSLVDALERGALSRHDLVNYLELPGTQLTEWRSLVTGASR
jgi:Zn-dependent peptidase ImmA (M78 family)